MLSRSSLAAAFLCVLALPPFAQDDAARLVPPKTSVLVRIESLSAWNEFVRAFAPLPAGEELASYNLLQFLDSMGWDPASEQPAANPTLNPARAVFLAVEFNPVAATLIAPTDSEAPFHFHPEFFEGREQSAHLGGYTGVSMSPGYAASATPSPLLATLQPGLASVHVDLAAIIATFRPLIDTGLRQVEQALDQLPQEQMPFDMEPMLESSLALARSVLDSAQTFDLALDRAIGNERDGDELALRFDYVERAERLPAVATVETKSLLGCVDPESAAQMTFAGNLGESFAVFADLFEAALEVYPEPLRADMRRLLTLQEWPPRTSAWSGGVGLRLTELLTFVQAMKALEAK